jgi:amino acid adenylation domain-containing protein
MRGLLQAAITAQAESRPDTLALKYRRESWSYGALEETSNRLAGLLVEAGCRRGDRVALMMSKSPLAIACMLGILKADACYVPLDPSGPAPRLARMLESADCSLLLAAGAVAPMLADSLAAARLEEAPRLGWLEDSSPATLPASPAFTLRDLQAHPARPRNYANRDTDLAHILFTSGSTGAPKGVMITHANVRHFVSWATAHFGIGREDRLSQHSPLHFDLSTFDVYGALSAGAELHLVPTELNLLPHRLAAFMGETGLTQWFSVPSVLNLMARQDAVPAVLPQLRRVLWCGETLPTPTLMHWMRRLPGIRYTNLYGPTEATIASSHHTVASCPQDERQDIPIGRPCEGEELLILDRSLRPVAAGESGDLYIAGPGLSPGYWRDDEKTRGVFLSRPGSVLPRPGGEFQDGRIYKTGDIARWGSDGLAYFQGRADSQIKSRGYRIELGEVESAANACGFAAECAIVAIPTAGFEGHAICCAYSVAPGNDAGAAPFRERLRSLLPAYMLPTRWKLLPEIPRNANGKIDRPALRGLFLRMGAGAAPETAAAESGKVCA